uniref:Reverse transcriptase domain-containing protein n=1 Tax=Tanacetum cinerariifolium TaxID=118510 RepID=A0A699H0U1_TANCI|nr:reverse transcriptase domain-containing protein [Tanacetum cinerariifolium]
MNTKEHDKKHRSRRSRSPRTSVFSKIRRERSRSPIRSERSRSPRQRGKEGGVFKRLGSRGKNVSARSDSYNQQSHSRYTEALSESEDSERGHWKSRSKKKKSSEKEDYLSQPWVCEETDPFTPRIRYFDFPKTRMPSHIKTYDGSEDPKDHLKIFQAAAKTERWAMPTWCHMLNSTLTGNARKKYIKDPIELHNIKQRDGESTKDFARSLRTMKLLEDQGQKVASGSVDSSRNAKDIDAYKGYHQIQMATEDEDKIAFITIQGIFCYTKMPFGIRNAGATYQRLVDKAFHKQIGRNLEVYVDDLVIKSRTEDEIVRDVEETFKTPREINMKLNPKKCAFGVKEGMFPGYKVNAKGLKVCPDKRNHCHSLKFEKMHEKSDFHWTTEAEDAFKQMTQLMAELPMLTALMEKEELIVYLAVVKETVSAVLMTEREAKQMPIYFVSRALRGPKLNYTSMKKLIVALVHVSKCLKRVSVKGQILTDFIVERPEEDSTDTPIEEEGMLPEPWILYTDGSSCTDGSRAGLIVTNPEGMKFNYALRFRFNSTNNEPEYEALIAGLRIAEQMGVKTLQENVDSRLVANQVNETYVAKEADIICYLEKGILPADVKKARAIKWNSWWFVVVNETLYKKYFIGPWLRCVGPLQANYILRDIHEGFCSMHAGTRSVMDKALRTGYYWPTIHRDTRTLIRACQDCQVHKPVLTNPQQKLTPIKSPCPFYKWGIDIAGPFSEGPEKVKFLIVAMDYFTKWIKAKLVTTITVNQIKKFVWDNVVCRFGLPREIISDNGKQFQDDPSKIGEGIKARLDARSKNWIEELPHVLWAHRTMIKSSNGDTPFSLTYETEAVISTEIGMPTLRTAEVDLVGNNKAPEINLDLLEEKIEEAAIREAKRKLGPKWEGPYEVMETLRKGAYKLRDCNGKQFPRTWNISNLKKCHIHKM